MTGLGRRTNWKWNQLTALRFQIREGHQTQLAFLLSYILFLFLGGGATVVVNMIVVNNASALWVGPEVGRTE